MIKYLQTVFDRLGELKSGINMFSGQWTNAAAITTAIDDERQSILDKNNEIETADDTLRILRGEGRSLRDAAEIQIENYEKQAIGIHASDSQNLVHYNIEERKDAVPRNRPEVVIALQVKDDSDGIGFALKFNGDPAADRYEIERGQTNTGGDINTIPDNFKIIKTTKKQNYIDDDVDKGTRYWYRVRAVNSQGEGPSSEPVSVVQ